MITRHLSLTFLLIASISNLGAMYLSPGEFFNRREKGQLEDKRSDLLRIIQNISNRLNEVKQNIEKIPQLTQVFTTDENEKTKAKQQQTEIEAEYTRMESQLKTIIALLNQEALDHTKTVNLCPVCNNLVDTVSFSHCEHKVHTDCLQRLKATETLSLDNDNEGEQESYRCPQCPGSTFTHTKEKRKRTAQNQQTEPQQKKVQTNSSVPAGTEIINLDDDDTPTTTTPNWWHPLPGRSSRSSTLNTRPENLTVNTTTPTTTTTTTTTNSTSITSTSSNGSSFANTRPNFLGRPVMYEYNPNHSNTTGPIHARLEYKKNRTGHLTITLSLIKDDLTFATSTIHSKDSPISRIKSLLVIPGHPVSQVHHEINHKKDLIDLLPTNANPSTTFILKLNNNHLTLTDDEFMEKLGIQFHRGGSSDTLYIDNLSVKRVSDLS